MRTSEEPNYVTPSPAEAEHWTVRIRADVDEAVKDLRFDSYWAGAIVLPYSQTFMPK